jgi:S-adenosyl methyltransferase
MNVSPVPVSGAGLTFAVAELMAEPVTLRTYDQVSQFLAGVGLVEPGLVQLHRWRPGPDGPVPATDIAKYGAVGRKPR